MTDVQDPAQAWSDVAAAWDANVDYVDEHSAEATAALLDRLSVHSGDRVLELAAGPGTLGPVLSKLVGPGGSVLVTDIAPGMVEVARRRNASMDNVACDVIDAAAIDRPDASFDVVVSRMGLMFAPRPEVALAEIRRVLGADGRLGATTWGGIEHNPWMTCVGMAAMAAGVATGGPPVGPGSIFSLGDPEHVRSLVENAGFRDVTVAVEPVSFHAPDLDTHLTRVGSLAGPLAALLDAATPDQRAALRDVAAGLATPYATATGYDFPGRILRINGAARSGPTKRTWRSDSVRALADGTDGAPDRAARRPDRGARLAGHEKRWRGVTADGRGDRRRSRWRRSPWARCRGGR